MTPDESQVYLHGRAALHDSPIAMRVAFRQGFDTGRAQYGGLCIDTDERDYHCEAGQELRDGLFYVAALEERWRRAGKDCAKVLRAKLLIVEAWELLGGEV